MESTVHWVCCLAIAAKTTPKLSTLHVPDRQLWRGGKRSQFTTPKGVATVVHRQWIREGARGLYPTRDSLDTQYSLVG